MHFSPGLPILYEDNHLLVVSKPVGLVTQGAAAGRTSVLDLARAYLKQKYDKPGNVYLGIVSRLDASSTGVLVLARTSKAAGRLAEQFRLGRVEKTYWAVVQGHPEPASGECVDWIMKDDRRHRMIVTQPAHRLAQQARLTYRTRVTWERETLLEIDLADRPEAPDPSAVGSPRPSDLGRHEVRGDDRLSGRYRAARSTIGHRTSCSQGTAGDPSAVPGELAAAGHRGASACLIPQRTR
jgi:hypothetical protein